MLVIKFVQDDFNILKPIIQNPQPNLQIITNFILIIESPIDFFKILLVYLNIIFDFFNQKLL